jgi:hypothetical protein
LRAAGRRTALFALSVLVLSGSVIVFHDYFCQEHDKHLHEICSPLHTAYENPEPFSTEAAIGSRPARTLPSVTVEGVLLAGFIVNIFHPPDLSA